MYFVPEEWAIIPGRGFPIGEGPPAFEAKDRDNWVPYILSIEIVISSSGRLVVLISGLVTTLSAVTVTVTVVGGGQSIGDAATSAAEVYRRNWVEYLILNAGNIRTQIQ